MNAPRKQIVIPREKAVFWMDRHGTWHNEHGKFQHPKIIRYFNSAIQKDDLGYYVSQVTDQCEEKVYFFYDETALFAVEVILDPPATLILNTGKQIPLDPDQLFTANDQLYCKFQEEYVKFTPQALVKLSRHMEEDKDQLCLRLGQDRYTIPNGQTPVGCPRG